MKLLICFAAIFLSVILLGCSHSHLGHGSIPNVVGMPEEKGISILRSELGPEVVSNEDPSGKGFGWQDFATRTVFLDEPVNQCIVTVDSGKISRIVLCFEQIPGTRVREQMREYGEQVLAQSGIDYVQVGYSEPFDGTYARGEVIRTSNEYLIYRYQFMFTPWEDRR